jgi:hypothetical protein
MSSTVGAAVTQFAKKRPRTAMLRTATCMVAVIKKKMAGEPGTMGGRESGKGLIGKFQSKEHACREGKIEWSGYDPLKKLHSDETVYEKQGRDRLFMADRDQTLTKGATSNDLERRNSVEGIKEWAVCSVSH